MVGSDPDAQTEQCGEQSCETQFYGHQRRFRQKRYRRVFGNRHIQNSLPIQFLIDGSNAGSPVSLNTSAGVISASAN